MAFRQSYKAGDIMEKNCNWPKKKMAIANFNIIPIIIATKVDVNNN